MIFSLIKRSVAVLLLLAAPLSAGSDLPVFRLTLKGHQFAPQKVTVPLGRKFKLVVSNEDAEPAEFESFVLHREQVVVGKSEAVVYLGPLKAGRYEFIDDFHSQTRGVIEAAAAEKK